MVDALFRLRLGGGEIRLAAGDVARGPERLLAPGESIDAILDGRGPALRDAIAGASEDLPAGWTLLAPVESQEVWAAGVTYERSREARVEEALEPSPYDRVYEAVRPELFEKSPAWRVRGHGEPIGIRRDSEWNVPEPELALVLDASLAIVGFTIGDDVSSRSIEGENTLYLPQAKVYTGSCALGPALVPASAVSPPFGIRLAITRDGASVYADETSTERIVRPFEELVAWLGAALAFPVGAVLLTGTGLVPPSDITLAEGDVVRIEIEGLGALENVVEVVGEDLRPTTSSAPAR
jgi:2-dehydro-3-deoxy-D-arabinonate dehydratase